MTDVKPWVQSFEKKDVRALSRLISLAENKDTALLGALSKLFSRTGKARVLGVTGPPGAGKSTIIGTLIRFLRDRKRSVAVVAVDPVSPFSGGALLGDRIRLADHFTDPDVYIRSLSTRGKLGGLSLASREVVHLLDAFGFDDIILETVGVGQSEVDIRTLADLTLVVLVPEWGDSVQALKAGLLEIGDLFVVNKADREGADRVMADLWGLLQMANRESAPLLATSTHKPETLQHLCEATEKLFSDASALIASRRKEFATGTARELLEDLVLEEAHSWVEAHSEKASNPYAFIEAFLAKHPRGTLFREDSG